MDRYRVNEPSVIHQTIAGETVIIHLEHGLYYSLNETGAAAWEALASGRTVEQTVDLLAARHTAPRAEIVDALGDLLERLRNEELVIPVDGEAPTTPSASADAEPSTADAPTPFSEPQLERFDDLRELLLLDPIHAVSESGWPDRRQSG